MWNWLVANGLLRDIVSAMVLVPIMHVMALKPLKRVESAVKRVEIAVNDAVSRDIDRIIQAIAGDDPVGSDVDDRELW